MLSEIKNLNSYQLLLRKIREKERIESLILQRSVRIPILAALHEDSKIPILYITDRVDHALTILEELSFWGVKKECFLFPEPGPLFYEQASWGSNIRHQRIKALATFASYQVPGFPHPYDPPLFIAPVRSVMTRTMPRRDFILHSKLITIQQRYQPELLQREWITNGYQFVDNVVEQGQISRRGGILDIWPPAENYPCRIDFFGDEVDSIRTFNPATQRTQTTLNSILTTPAKEFLLPKEDSPVDLPDEINEFFLPIIHPNPASILDYLPFHHSLIVLESQDLLQSTASEIEEKAVRMREDLLREGLLPQNYPVPYLSWSEIEDALSMRYFIDLGRSAGVEPSELSSMFQPAPRFGGRIPVFLDHIRESQKRGNEQVVVSRQVSRLKELWRERFFDSEEANFPKYFEGSLSEGWVLTKQDGGHLSFYTDSEIFGWERPQPRHQIRQTAITPETQFSDMRIGDWVVHLDYGIGIFRGLVKRSLEGAEREYLCVEYDKGDQIYVPVFQADRLTRYIGPDGETPAITRLGGGEWNNTRQKVKEAVIEVARELLQLYARRQVAKGHAFSKDTAWQKELEASFPYQETNDQIVAIADVKTDMENSRPMDRLLCGDVGYGKTEVALRAAFKAVMDGKQVAFLVPTTVLAQQHFETFRQRLAPFPMRVEMLSRFRTQKEQEEILLDLALGVIDIVIGTHRLIQADVEFKDLGLLIIDEEQRFGVTHKEHFKKLRSEVDVLTLTATPIPRTLYMALTGVRDISMINTPPAERLPVITHIGPYSPRLVRQAIIRELERGGQVFFVHNRVQTIRGMESHLQKLVPEAKIGVAHGQMPEGDLAVVMHKFNHGEIDVLLCTSIIESGLDIPNANTLIVDRGDTFGLAQLYQLRGRVGRGAQRAYAYFFKHRKKAPTQEGQERLDIIAENTQLGAGYSIAMRDLEMRGAGDLLGTRQHGYIAAVGFYLYTRLLSQAVRELRKTENLAGPEEVDLYPDMTLPVNVDLPLDIGIPADYIPNQNIRLQLYRRLANIDKEELIDEITAEFIDRFGKIPEQVLNLLYQIRVKLKAIQAGLSSVSVEGDQIVFRFPPLAEGTPVRQLPFLDKDVRSGKNAYWMIKTMPKWKEKILDLLTALIEYKLVEN